jgi:tetratricopeptide (TPR) repeat protein
LRCLLLTFLFCTVFSYTQNVSGPAGNVGTQSTATAAIPTVHAKCSILHTKADAGETALVQEDFKLALKLYLSESAAAPDDALIVTGLMRAQLGMGQLENAQQTAEGYAARHPNTAVTETMLAELHMKMGDMDEAIQHINKAIVLDSCYPQAHFQASHLLWLSGERAKAAQQLTLAHQLMPDDPLIEQDWNAAQAKRKPFCESSTPVEHATIELQASGFYKCILGLDARPGRPTLSSTCHQWMNLYRANNVEILSTINQQQIPLNVDSGVSGILLTAHAARMAGVNPQQKTGFSVIGSNIEANGRIAEVQNLVIGGIKYKYCTVKIMNDHDSDLLNGYGLIGTDFFREYLETLDIPHGTFLLDPLPELPKDGVVAVPLGENLIRDRYISPEMKNWVRIYSDEHEILVPTVFGDVPKRLFVLDTGSSMSIISPEAAKSVSTLKDTNMRMGGTSGEISEKATLGPDYRWWLDVKIPEGTDSVKFAKQVTLEFAGIKQNYQNMFSFDPRLVLSNNWVGYAGLIGFQTLKPLRISIDYRDNLLKAVYTPPETKSEADDKASGSGN